MKLTYWYCECLNDAQQYNIREKTRRQAIIMRDYLGAERFGPPTKVSVEYWSGFDLMRDCLSEGGGCWEIPEQSS